MRGKTRKIDMYNDVPESFHVQLCDTLDALEEKKTVPLHSKKYAVVLAAAVLACASLTVGAAKFFEWHEGASQSFGTEKELENKLTAQGAAIPENDVTTGDGITFEALQSVKTDNYYYFLVNVVLPENMEWNEDIIIEGADVISDEEFGGCSVNFMNDSYKDGRVLMEILVYPLSNVAYGNEVTIGIANLVQASKAEITDTLVEGSWELTFTLPQDAETIVYETARKLIVNNHELIIDRVEISPFQIRMYTEEESARHAVAYDGTILTKVQYEDGGFVENSELSFNQAGQHNDAGEFYFGLNLDNAIDPDKAAALVFRDGGKEVHFAIKSSEATENVKTDGVKTDDAAESMADTVKSVDNLLSASNMTSLSEWIAAVDGNDKVADMHLLYVRYGNVILADENHIYLWDAVCGNAQCLVTLSDLGYSAEAGGEYTMSVNGGLITIHPQKDSDIVINCAPSAEEAGWRTWEMPAENLWPVPNNEIYMEKFSQIEDVIPNADDRYSREAGLFQGVNYCLFSEDSTIEKMELLAIGQNQ